MADLIQNVQEVYKKWDSRRPADFSTRKRRDGPHSSYGRRNYGRNGFQQESYANSNRPGDRRYKQRNRTPYFKLPEFDGLAQFKMAPCVVAENKPRPFMGSCCVKCLPMSRAAISDKRLFSLSVYNVLHIPHFQRLDFNLVLDILKKNQKPLYPDVSCDILKSDKVRFAIEAASNECKDNDLPLESLEIIKTVQYDRAKVLLESLKTSVSTVCLQLSSFFLQYVLGRVFSGILVHKGQIEILKTVSQDNVPFLYLPVHRSHLDYFLVSFILYMNSLKVPLVVTDSDLYIPILGYLSKLIGAFYIQKCLECDKISKDHIQSAIVKSYLTQSLKAGHSLELFLESSRSRSGKPQIPKVGLLSAVVDSVTDGTVEDVYVSTVSISYERIMDGNFVSEQLGQPKAKESLFTKLYSIWKMLHFNFGNVRLNFGQPFSLKEFLKSSSKKIPTSPKQDTPLPSNVESYEESKSQIHSTVKNLAQHIIYDATFATSLMSTQLVAFLLVTQYRKGATQQQLQNSLEWLRGELLRKKRDAGFTGESLPVIKRSVELLGKHLITSETIDMEWTSSDMENNNVKITIYKPIIKLPHVLELQYYANSVVPVFLLDSMMANALYALVDVEICHFRHCDSKLYVFREKLISKSIELCDMLQFEFIAIPPCSDISLAFSDTLDELIERECLHVAGVSILPTRAQYVGKPHALSFEASDVDSDNEQTPIMKEQQLKIDLSEESINHLEFLRNVLSPYIESYWLAACTLLKLIDEIMEENAFIQEMQITAQEKLYKGLLGYEESFSADTFKNSLKLFELWHVIELFTQDGIKVVYLNANYNCKEKINDIIARIEEFRK